MPRRRQWEDFLFDLDLTNGSRSITDLTRVDADEAKGMTLVRIILKLEAVELAVDGEIAAAMMVSAGIGVTGLEAIDLGVTAVAHPGTATEIPPSGWMWRDRMLVISGGQTRSVFTADLRSQRKLLYGGPFLTIANDPQQGTAFTISVVGIVRCLYLLA